MRYANRSQDGVDSSFDSEAFAGPSSVESDDLLTGSTSLPSASNGHSARSNGNGALVTNGSSSGLKQQTLYTSPGTVQGRPVEKSIAPVNLPGTRLYTDAPIDREEFIRLVVQSLRDVGYMYVTSNCRKHPPANSLILPHSESAATLEAESGYSMEVPEVSRFKQCILNADWGSAESYLAALGVFDEENIRVRSKLHRKLNCLGLIVILFEDGQVLD